MIPRTRRSFRVFAIGGALCLSSWSLAPRPLAAPVRLTPSCTALQDWAQSYMKHTVVRYDTLAAFDRPHRVALFNAMTPETRAALMRDQLSRFAQRPDLSTTQRALVREAIPLMTTAFYRQEPSARQAAEAFWTRARRGFTRDAHLRPWYELGPPQTFAARPTRAAATASSQEMPYCECSDVSWFPECYFAGPNHFCIPSWCQAWLGCGWMGGYVCDGFCVQYTGPPIS